MMRLLALVMSSAAIVAVPAVAQTAAPQAAQAAAPTVGATIYDAQGAEVGKIESVANGNAVVNTGTNKVALPLASFGDGPKGPVLGMTKAELDAAAGKAQADASAQLQSQLTAGTAVFARDGTASLGTVKAADASFVTLTTAKGEVKLPANAFASQNGKVVIGMTAAEFETAVGSAAASAAPAADPATGTESGTAAPAEQPGEPAQN